MRSQKLERYRKLKAEEPNQSNTWYAKQLGVDPSTITRWNQHDEERSLYDRLKEELKAELETEIRNQIAVEQQAEEAKEATLLARLDLAVENKRAYCQLVLKESPEVTVTYPAERQIQWQGFSYRIPANTPTKIPQIIKGELDQQDRNCAARDAALSALRR